MESVTSLQNRPEETWTRPPGARFPSWRSAPPSCSWRPSCRYSGHQVPPQERTVLIGPQVASTMKEHFLKKIYQTLRRTVLSRADFGSEAFLVFFFFFLPVWREARGTVCSPLASDVTLVFDEEEFLIFTNLLTTDAAWTLVSLISTVLVKKKKKKTLLTGLRGNATNRSEDLAATR